MKIFDRYHCNLIFMMILQSCIMYTMQKNDIEAEQDWKKELAIIFQESSIVRANPKAFENYVDNYCVCLKALGPKAFYEQIAKYKLTDNEPKDFYEHMYYEANVTDLEKNNLFADLLVRSTYLYDDTVKAIALLTKYGANVNISIPVNRILESREFLESREIFCKNYTPLNFALHNNSRLVFLHLIEAGADVNVDDSEAGSPLYYIAHRFVNIFFKRKVYAHGLNIDRNVQDEWCLQFAKQLIEKGALVDAKTLNGDSPLSTAIRRQDVALLSLLLISPQVDLKMLNQFDVTNYPKSSILIEQKKKELAEAKLSKGLREWLNQDVAKSYIDESIKGSELIFAQQDNVVDKEKSDIKTLNNTTQQQQIVIKSPMIKKLQSDTQEDWNW